MSFVPEVVSTTRYSNRTADASTSSNKVDGALADSANPSKPRFLPEPIETTRRSNRTALASPDYLPPDSSSPSSSNSSTPKATLLPNNPVDAFASPAPQKPSRFLPEPVETSKRSNRTQAVKPSNSNRKGWGRDSDDDYEAERLDAQRNASGKTPAAAMSLNLGHQQRIPPGKSKWVPDDESTRWGGQHNYCYQPRHQPAGAAGDAGAAVAAAADGRIQSPTDAYSHAKVNSSGLTAAIGENSRQNVLPEQATSSTSAKGDSGDPRQINHSPNEVVCILSSTVTSNRASSAKTVCSGDQEATRSASLSSSPSLKDSAPGPNHPLSETSAVNHHHQHSLSPLRDLTIVPTVERSVEEPLNLTDVGAPQPAGVKLPSSPGTVLVRDSASPSISTRNLPKPDASACSPCPTAAVVPKAQTRTVEIAQRTVSGRPHTNNQPSPLGITSANLNPSTPLDHTTPTTASKFPTAADLRDQVLAAQSQLIKDRQQALLTPKYTPSIKQQQPQQHQQQRQQQLPLRQPHLNPPSSKFPAVPPPNGSDEPKRKRPLLPFSFIPAAPRPMNSPLSNGLLSPRLIPPATTPLICESPMPTTLYYESSKTHGSGDYFTSKKEKQPSAMSISSNSSALSRDTALTTPSTRPSSPGPLKYGYPSTSTSSLVQMMCQTPPPEHLLVSDPPNMCPKRRCEVSPEFVVAVFNYLSLGHESIARKFDKELSQATGWGLDRVVTDRLGALREYVEEYVDQKPVFGSGMGGW
ncbi:hypothetical protein TWF696_001483 [Orbilia brochopaga]|uniref:Uncharacterized protein n=1 Tax=Orbilia brochopaga TaxID=3140254 RepID=A0AAV9UAH1_9PEZI